MAHAIDLPRQRDGHLPKEKRTNRSGESDGSPFSQNTYTFEAPTISTQEEPHRSCQVGIRRVARRSGICNLLHRVAFRIRARKCINRAEKDDGRKLSLLPAFALCEENASERNRTTRTSRVRFWRAGAGPSRSAEHGCALGDQRKRST
jgi:hypothetical protein